jgi:hypothetical protein
VAQDEPHVSVGGLLAAGKSGKKDDHGERKHAETEVTAGGKHNMRACKKACTRKAQLEGRTTRAHGRKT